MLVGSSMCTMNLSDGGIDAFRLTMNCAIGTSQEMNSPLIALTILPVLWTGTTAVAWHRRRRSSWSRVPPGRRIQSSRFGSDPPLFARRRRRSSSIYRPHLSSSSSPHQLPTCPPAHLPPPVLQPRRPASSSAWAHYFLFPLASSSLSLPAQVLLLPALDRIRPIDTRAPFDHQ